MAEEDKIPQSSPSSSESSGPACACTAGPMRWVWLIIIVAAVVFLVTHNRNNNQGPGIIWQSDYEQALADAKEQNKPVLLVFHADWCGPCRMMKEDTYTDPTVIASAEPFVRVYIDTDKQSDVAQSYNITGIPAYRVLSPTGEEVSSLSGLQPSDLFASWLQKGLEKTLDKMPTNATIVVWRSDYQEAMNEAKSQNKPVLIVFHADWCGPCRKMKKDTYSDAAVIAAADPFIRVYIDTDKQPDVAETYNVSGIPAFYVLSPAGNVVTSTVGYQPPKEFVAWLRQGFEKAVNSDNS